MDKAMQGAVVKVAKRAGFEPAALLAVVEIESLGRAFEMDHITPCLLFERHIFYRQLKKLAPGKLPAAEAQGLTRQKWDRATQYKDEGTSQARLQLISKARSIDEEIANQSASWGVGQTMGFNAKQCGFSSATAMVTAMADVTVQIEAMVREINSNKSAAPLKRHDWANFARLYNGAGYAANRYDVRLEAAYDKWVKALDPNDAETGEERVIIPPSRNAEPESMGKSSIGNGAIVTGGSVASGGGLLVVNKIADHLDDVSDGFFAKVVHILTTPGIVLPLLCIFLAVGGCGYIWYKRHQMKQSEGL